MMEGFSAKKKLFGKEVEIAIWGAEESIAFGIIEDAYKEGLRLERIFNLFEPSSELSLLNSKRKLAVSKVLLTVIKKAILFSKSTSGAYDISLGRLFLSRKKKEKEPKLCCSYKDIKIKKNVVELVHPDALIDLGSIAKGYIADKIAMRLKGEGVISGMVDARGDIIVFGNQPQVIGIQHPREMEKLAGYVSLSNSAIATSGDYNQYNKTFEKSHIINNKDAASVTVVAKDLMTADAYATAIMVCGKKQREILLSNDNLIKALVIGKDLKMEYYNGFEKILVGKT